MVKNRKHSIIVEEGVSDWKLVLSGVLQGSVLGPLLLLVHIHVLDSDTEIQILKLAGDTKLYSKFNKSSSDKN